MLVIKRFSKRKKIFRERKKTGKIHAKRKGCIWACKRELLGLDGAFMKGLFPCQVLVAVGLDSNNRIYPLAYALVEAESKSSWRWVSFQPLKLSASATSVKEFEKCMLELKKMNSKAHEWLNKIPP
ncbi:integrase, catalytic region, zinc finger, CCHC-type containing protein [Tanacetum coccineum]